MSAPRTDLQLVAGEPFEQSARIVGGASIWPTPDSREVRGMLAEYEGGCAVRDLAPFLSVTVDGPDLTLTLRLNGQDTRRLPTAGFYDTFVSDPGPVDQRAVRCLWGSMDVQPAATTGEGSL